MAKHYYLLLNIIVPKLKRIFPKRSYSSNKPKLLIYLKIGQYYQFCKIRMSSMNKKAPPFLIKTYEMLEKQQFYDTIRWNQEQNGFIIQDIQKFSSNILPYYFKHKNMHSYIRQLNMYGFSKKRGRTNNYYYHPFFVRKQPELISQIQRRVENKAPKNNKNSNASIEDQVPEQLHIQLLKMNQMLLLEQMANLQLIVNQIVDYRLKQEFQQISSAYVSNHNSLLSKFSKCQTSNTADTLRDKSEGVIESE